jgi:membrane associated rhomboid family serine protease
VSDRFGPLDPNDPYRFGRPEQPAPEVKRRASRPARSQWGPTPVTLVLVALNVVVYFATGLGKAYAAGWPKPSLQDPSTGRWFIDGALIPAAIHIDHEFYRLLTSAFLHLSPLHIAANMFSLLIIGPTLERLLGPSRFLAVYLLGALGGGTLIYLFGDAGAPVAGASGAIFGLFATALIFARRLGLDMSWLVMTVVINFAITFSVSGISKLGHVGGFIGGALAALAITWWPPARRTVKPPLQAAGLGAVLVLMLVAVVVRTQIAL